MLKKPYISPEFEWFGVDLIEDVLNLSNPDLYNDDDNEITDDNTQETESDGGEGYGHDNDDLGDF